MDIDEIRYRRFEELQISGVAKEVVLDFKKDLEDKFNIEFHEFVDKEEYSGALRKICWSLLLPDPSPVQRQRQIDKAIFALKCMNRTSEEVDSIQDIKERRFDNVRKILKEKWTESLKQGAIEEFHLLDGAKLLLEKNFRRLIELLNSDGLPHPNSNYFLLAKARLIREKEAADRFIEVKNKYEGIMKITDPNQITEAQKDVQTLGILAVEFAAHEGSSEYVSQIKEYVRTLRNLLDTAETLGSRARMEMKANKLDDELINEFRSLLMSDTEDPSVILRRICADLKGITDGNPSDRMRELSMEWAKTGAKGQYGNYLRNVQDKATYIDDSIALISEHRKYLPKEFSEDLLKVLEEYRKRFESHQPPTFRPAVPEAPRRGLFQWVENLLKKVLSQ